MALYSPTAGAAALSLPATYYRELAEKWGNVFTAGMGAEAVREINAGFYSGSYDNPDIKVDGTKVTGVSRSIAVFR